MAKPLVGRPVYYDEERAKAKREFIDAMLESSTITHACKTTNIPRSNIYKWRKDDEEFEQEIQLAIELSTELLEDAVYDWALKGIVRESYNKDGDLVSREVRPADACIKLVLSGRKPEKYRERFELPPVDPNRVAGGLFLFPARLAHQDWIEHAYSQRELAQQNEKKQLVQLGEREQ